RRRTTRLGISGASAREPVPTTNAEYSCRRQGPEGTMPPAVEGNCRRPPCLATGARGRTRTRVVRECGGRRHDTSRFRIHPQQTRFRRSEELLLFKWTLCVAPPTSAHLCGYHAPGHPGHPQG